MPISKDTPIDVTVAALAKQIQAAKTKSKFMTRVVESGNRPVADPYMFMPWNANGDIGFGGDCPWGDDASARLSDS